MLYIITIPPFLDAVSTIFNELLIVINISPFPTI